MTERDAEGSEEGTKMRPAVANGPPDYGDAVSAHGVGEEVTEVKGRDDSLSRLPELGEPGHQSRGGWYGRGGRERRLRARWVSCVGGR